MAAAARTLASRCAAAPALLRSSSGLAAAGPSRFALAASRSLATNAAPATSGSSATPPPPPAGAGASSSKDAATSPKLTGLVDAIEKLTLLEAAELVTALKTRLNITEVAMPAASAAPAAAAPAAAAPAAEEEKPKEKTVFTIKLKGLKDATAKAKVIREVKAINSSMNLVEAKKFVESAPQTLKEGVNKEEAEKIKKAIEDAGGVIELD
ncbi:54S ribosomal protein L12, mitochondrial [Tilletia horrida]|uniref:54S ribosomal protein L12, mitochondrial n=1 Tax=Tilletia horrida TaxID=155126 RepID=A0AAN6JLA4_9BASI|nr:54S ribosomal protein L12, mitochondrial [Tilletia horrida]KAK0525496.1 54S ribosomal protein L12, mitochondrial [Tilletia horrida]KAK0533867.1 54S ribosomal protein L12, mitochondrial [Tilletia horrida]KAK0562973.1 54S ribosomal protein L12, mitochondrial [Tilletia horrida]